MADSNTRQRSVASPEETEQVLKELQVAFNVPSYTAVIGRALNLAQLIAREAKDDHTITIECKDGSQLQIVLNA
jgi:redox-regulated HSP33 family molecular chaperone